MARSARENTPPSDKDLAEIEERGNALAARRAERKEVEEAERAAMARSARENTQRSDDGRPPEHRAAGRRDAQLRGNWQRPAPGIPPEIWGTLRPDLVPPVLLQAQAWKSVVVRRDRRAWLSVGVAGDREFLLPWVPGSRALVDPAHGLVTAPITVSAGPGRPTLLLSLRIFTEPDPAAEPAKQGPLREALVEYFANRVGGPAFDLITSGWETETDPLETAAAGLEHAQEWLHGLVIGGPIEWLLAVGLELPAPVVDEGRGFAQGAIELPGDEFLGHLIFGLRIASILLCAMSGNPVLAAESTKSLLKRCFIDLLTKGLESTGPTQSQFDTHSTWTFQTASRVNPPQTLPSWVSPPPDDRKPHKETRTELPGHNAAAPPNPTPGHPGPGRDDLKPDGPSQGLSQ